MNIFTSLLLGIIQGLTEFLPVSSSGHLVIAESFFVNFESPGVLFETVVHMGTLFAILYFYKERIKSLNARYIKLIIVGSIPALILGLLLNSVIGVIFNNVKMVGYLLLLTGLMNWYTDKANTRKSKISYPISFMIGLAQAMAIYPGISRSGSTIYAGSLLGINRKKAAEFSFLLSVPVVLGANFLQLTNGISFASINLTALIAGFLSAFISGYFGIKLAVKYLVAKSFKTFAFYTIFVGGVIILLG